LSDRITTALQQENERLVEAVSQQDRLLQPGDADQDVFLELEKIQKELLDLGKSLISGVQPGSLVGMQPSC